MQLSEYKTYRTRDWRRRGIRVKRVSSFEGPYFSDGERFWHTNGKHIPKVLSPDLDLDLDLDLIEDTPDPTPFSYEACPTGTDGRKRAVTRDGREVVLLCGDAPGSYPVWGWWGDDGSRIHRRPDGCVYDDRECSADLLIPAPPKRVVWVNIYGNNHATNWSTQSAADEDAGPDSHRLGNRAYPIEIDP